jgi:hypothetical protein
VWIHATKVGFDLTEMYNLEEESKRFVEESSRLTEEYLESINKLGEEYSEKVIIPFCRKHNLGFISGMGHIVFYRNGGKGDPIMEWELKDPKWYKLRHSAKTLQELELLMKTLDEPLDTPVDHLLGFYCYGEI